MSRKPTEIISRKKYFDLVLILFFCLLIIMPYLGSIFGVSSKFDNTERRTLAKFPTFTLETMPNWSVMLTQYLNDNFGFRNVFLQSYKVIKINVLESQFIFRNIYANGWIFEPGGSQGHLKDYYSKASLTNADLNLFKSRLREERDLLAKKGIAYIVVVVPKKQSIYPEYYPYKYPVFDLKLNQLTEHLKSSEINFIDLRQDLLAAKNELPIYYRSDTHWTNYGAFIGYQAVMKQFSKTNPGAQPLEEDDLEFTLDKYQLWNGDNAGQFYNSPVHPDYGASFTVKNKEKINPQGSVLIFGDSYIHSKRGLTKQQLDELFPEIKDQFDLLFKKAPYRDIPLDMVLPIAPIEKLIPIIQKEITDPQVQKRLITFLINSGVKDDDLEGIARFLIYNFEKVILEDKNKALTLEEIEQFNPSLVIRETEQMSLETLYLRDNGYQKETMILSLKDNL